MNKINKIRISDFRIYHGEAEFDFTKNDSVANLVAIYAPNGYGKTSFFDAVEWSYSGKIMRLESNEILKKSLKDSDFSLQDKIVLTNRKSYKNSKKKLGKVEIETQGKTLIRKVTKRKRAGVNIIDDYRSGSLNNNFLEDDIKSLTSTNLLSQDQIDSFLRYKTPEEKFNELKVFWPQGGEAVSTFKNLNVAQSAVNEKLSYIESEIDKLTQKIKEIDNSEEAIEQINQSIKLLTKDKNSSFSSDLLTKTFTKSEYEGLLKSCMFAISEVKKNIDKRGKDEAELVELLSENDTYNKNIVALERLEKELQLINNKKKLYADLNSLEKQKLELEKTLSEIKNKHNDYLLFQNGKVKFTNDKLDIKKYFNEIKSLKLKRNNIKNKIYINQNWLNKIQASKKQLALKLSIKKEEYKEYSTNSKNFFDLKKLIKPANEELKKLKVSQDINSQAISEIQNTIRNLTSIVNKKEWGNEYLNQFKSLVPIISKLKYTTRIIEELEKKFKNQKSEFDNSNSLNESLEKIKGWGENYVEKTGAKTCPLCTTEFEAFSDLITKIKSQKDKALKIDELRKSIEEITKEIQKNTDKKNELVNILKEHVSNLITSDLDDFLKLQDELQNKQFTLQKRVKDIENETLITSKSLRKCVGEAIDLEEKSVNEFESEFIAHIELLDFSLTRISKVIEKREIKDNLFKRENLRLSEKVRINENKIEQLEETHSYQLLNGLLKKYQLETISEDILDKVFRENTKNNDLIKAEINTTNIKIENIKEHLLNSDCDYKSSEIEGMLVDFGAKEIKLSTATKNYQSLYKKHTENSDVSIRNIELQRNEVSKIKVGLESAQDKLESFQVDMGIIENAIEKNILEKDVTNLKRKIPALKNAERKITKTKKTCIEYIQEGINNYFNKDVINQIYKRIEPHPSLTEINFTAEVGKQGPRLLITAKGLNDEVNPNLFLSAGQVNILSLSIFLAKAFEYGGDTISTIFMDDPVQNLSDINILSFIDLLRTLTTEHNKQIVLSTHEEKFFRLLQNKLPPEYCSSKYLEFESEGKLLNEVSRI